MFAYFASPDTDMYPSNSTVSKNAGIEPRAVAEFALTVSTIRYCTVHIIPLNMVAGEILSDTESAKRGKFSVKTVQYLH